MAQKQTADSTAKKSAIINPVPVPTVSPKKKDWSKVNMTNRSNDHLLIQVAYDNWLQTPDSIHIKGFSRSLNMYLMYDFLFKTDPRFSVGVGLGIGSSSIFFDKQEVTVANLSGNLGFPDESQSNHFKKYKLASTYAEVPVELRFVADPHHNRKSWKAALGLKIGALVDVHTKGKTLVSSSGATINDYIEKFSSKRFFNTTRLAGTARIGYGHISLFGQIQINNYIKSGQGPNVIPFSIGITFSGL